MYYIMTESTSVRLPDEIARKLDELAKVIDRPKTYIITKALREYIEGYEDYLIALGRLNDKDDKIISGKQLRDTVGI